MWGAPSAVEVTNPPHETADLRPVFLNAAALAAELLAA
jgi:hypothetical protein